MSDIRIYVKTVIDLGQGAAVELEEMADGIHLRVFDSETDESDVVIDQEAIGAIIQFLLHKEDE